MIGLDTLQLTMSADDSVLQLSDTIPQLTRRGGSYLCTFANYQAYYDPVRKELHFDHSIQKAVDGQNVKCDINAQRLKFEEVSDLLHLDLKRANVDRADVATTIELPYKPTLIFPKFGEMQGFQKEEQPNGLYYNKYTKESTIRNVYAVYDKIKELRQKAEPVPMFCNGGNWLRLEYRTYYAGRRYKYYGLQVMSLGLLTKTTKGRFEQQAPLKLLRIKDIDMQRQMNLKATNDREALRAIIAGIVGHVPTDSEVKKVVDEVRMYNGKELPRDSLSRAKKKVLQMFADFDTDNLKSEIIEKLKSEF